jgi:uracil-DNA glycosylase family 4
VSRPGSDAEQVRARLADLRSADVDGLPRRARAAAAPRDEQASAVSEPGLAKPLASSLATGPLDPGEHDLDGLRAALVDCGRCKLCSGRTQVVYGVGNRNARVMFVGEAPGRDEDLQGEPFVGRAGQLLTDMIEKGMGLTRPDVYIANVVKCRPPENRNPEPDEIAACAPFLARQVALVKPEVIVALGKFAAQTLLRTDVAIGKLRGRWHDYEGTPLMPTFHPSYLLRSPGEKRHAWEDLKQVMSRLGI